MLLCDLPLPALSVGLHGLLSWPLGSQVFPFKVAVKQWVTCSESSSAASSSDDPHTHLILATQRRLQGFFWTLLSLLSLRFQMLF